MTITTADIAILEWIQHYRLVSLDPVLAVFSSATTYVSLAFILMIGIFSRFRRSCLNKILQVGLTLFLAALIVFILKNLIQRERPFRETLTVEKLAKGGSPSFPSGHAMEAFAMATSISLLFRRKEIQVPVFLWACLVGYSRMVLGVHYPSDVIGGILTGIILALSVDLGFRKWLNVRMDRINFFHSQGPR